MKEIEVEEDIKIYYSYLWQDWTIRGQFNRFYELMQNQGKESCLQGSERFTPLKHSLTSREKQHLWSNRKS